MVNSKENNHLAELTHDLESISSQVQDLIKEIQEGAIDFAETKTELRILNDNFKELADLIRDGNGTASIITRMALVEQAIKRIEEWIKSQEDGDAKIKAAHAGGKWQLTAAIVTAVLGLIASAISLLLNAK